jgi:tetratricopeptide (TPR) repeat protein
MLANTNSFRVFRRPDQFAWFGLLCLLCLALAGCAGLGADDGGQSLASDCVWVLTVKDPQLAATAGPRLRDGRAFIIEGRRLAREHPATVRQELGCPPLSGLPHRLVEAAERLELGQVAGPLESGQGATWVMRGSDRQRLLGQAMYERKRYPEAMEAAQLDLALNPASVGSWLVLGQSRLALDDPAGALQAFEHGLLVDLLEPRLREGRDQARRALAQPAATPAAPAPLQPAAPVPIPAPTAAPTVVKERPLLAPAVKPPPIQTQPEPGATAPAPAPASATEAQVLLDQARQAEARGDRRAATLAYHRAARLDPANETAREGLRRNFLALDLGAGPAAPAASLVRTAAPASPAPGPSSIAPPAPVPADDKAKPGPAVPPAKAAPLVPAAPPAPPVKTARQTPPTRLAKGVYIQVASNRDLADADQEAAAWKRRKLPTLVSSWQARDGVVWWRVLLGPYPDRKRAQATAQRLRRQGALDFHLLVEAPRP